MGIAYHSAFEADFFYDPALFVPPFFIDAPGIIGAKYLKSPVDPGTGEEVGLTLFTVHENPSSPGAQFFDPFRGHDFGLARGFRRARRRRFRR